MTGEIFEVLRTHSVLRHSLQGELDGPDRDLGFTAGLAQGLERRQRLTATLFKVRAGSLLSGRSAPLVRRLPLGPSSSAPKSAASATGSPTRPFR